MRPPDSFLSAILIYFLLVRLCVGLYRIENSQRAALCDLKTVDYITHTLQQQCLRNDWVTSPVSGHEEEQPSATSTHANEPHKPQAGVTRIADPTDSTPTLPDAATSASGDSVTPPFMSFEDWKEMMLRKTGQDPNDSRGRRQADQKPDREAGQTDHELDNTGDEGDIPRNTRPHVENPAGPLIAAEGPGGDITATGDRHGDPGSEDGLTHYTKSKDAGKTCKERFSYASFDAGATVLKTSPGGKNAKAILAENKDSYMLLECARDNKYVIVELSDDILVDTVVLANFEFFSSMVRHFRVSVSERYPVKLDKWKELGTFEAKNSRDIQPFLVENPLIYAKYFRIEFLTHYGNEYYCPVSLLRVHGSRMLESWKDSEQQARDDDESDGEAESPLELPNATSRLSEPSALLATTPSPTEGFRATSPTKEGACHVAQDFRDNRFDMCPATPRVHMALSLDVPYVPFTTIPPDATSTSSYDIVSVASQSETVLSVHEDPVLSESPVASSASAIQGPGAIDTVLQRSPLTNSTAPPSSQPPHPDESEAPVMNVTGKSASSPPATLKNKTASATATTSGSPAVQESFFKTVTKRLQLLEANITLSLKYMEDQSKHMQEALHKVERRQLDQVDQFLDSLNRTVFSELRSVRQKYDQVWQSTVIALESQRDHAEREIIALSARLNILADEVVFQKRMSILQSVLLLSCLVLVVFSRALVAPAVTTVAGVSVPFSSSLVPATPGIMRRRDANRDKGAGVLGRQERDRSQPGRGHIARRPHHVSQRASSTPSLPGRIGPEGKTTGLSYEDQAISRRLSPPLSPRPPTDGSGPPLHIDSQVSGSSSRVQLSYGDPRKPLPALPEQPD